MKFMLLIVDGDPRLPMPSEAELGPMMATFQKIGADLGAAGKLVHSERLRPQSEAKTVRLSSDRKRSVVDGPFTETKELVAGFWLWQVKSLEEAIEWVKRCPNPHAGDSEIEIRQVFEMEDFAPILSEEQIQHKERLRAQLPNQTAKK
jgi:hypothetical protein